MENCLNKITLSYERFSFLMYMSTPQSLLSSGLCEWFRDQSGLNFEQSSSIDSILETDTLGCTFNVCFHSPGISAGHAL